MTITEERARRPLTLAEEVLLTQLPAPPVRRAIREAAKVSLRRLAQELQVSHGSIAYYERGGKPGAEIAIRYRRVLDDLAAACGYEHQAKPQK